MGRAKRLRKARMASRSQARAIRSLVYHWRMAKHVASLKRLTVLKLRANGHTSQAWRYGPESRRGRNPKVLAKRRRQRERLAEQAVLDSYGWLDLLAMLEEPERDERGCWRIHRNMASERAERLHAIAEGR